MVGKGILISAASLLICSCNVKAFDGDIKIRKSSDINIREIEIGKALSLDQIKSMTTFEGEFEKLSDVECGGFFTEEEIGESGEEAIYRYDNMMIDITGDQGAIMQIIGIPNGVHAKYNDLLIDNNFNPNSLSIKRFEIHKNEATFSDRTVGIDSTGTKTVYDIMYSIREKTSDDLLYVYFLDNKLVAVKALVQC